jgi:hypothetical protein
MIACFADINQSAVMAKPYEKLPGEKVQGCVPSITVQAPSKLEIGYWEPLEIQPEFPEVPWRKLLILYL